MRRFTVLIFALLALTFTLVAQERDRTKVPDRYKWNLADIYPNEAAWRTAKDRLAGELPQLREYKGKLTTSAATLAAALDTQSQFDKELSRLYVYASMLADQDTREARPQGMRQEMAQLAATFGAESAYIEPEILKADKAALEKFIASEPRLKVYQFYLHDVIRRAAHTLSDAEEKLLADAGPMAGSAANVFNIIQNADFPYPTIA